MKKVGSLTLSITLLTGAFFPVDVEAKSRSFNYYLRTAIREVREDSIRNSPFLYREARSRARYIAKRDSLDGHRGAFKRPSNTYGLYGEIFGWRNRSGNTVKWWIDAWMNSPTHRAVLLGDWDRLAVSCARNKPKTKIYCVVEFGRYK